MVDPQTTQRISDKIRECIDKANSLYAKNLEIPSFSYKQIGRVAGRAFLNQWKIVINPDFLFNGHLEDMIENTVPHEIAHLIAFRLFNDNGHGRFWKMVMVHLGLNPERCHNYSLEGVKTRKSKRNVKCACPTCGEQFHITQYKAKHILLGAKVYHNAPLCRDLKNTLLILEGS